MHVGGTENRWTSSTHLPGWHRRVVLQRGNAASGGATGHQAPSTGLLTRGSGRIIASGAARLPGSGQQRSTPGRLGTRLAGWLLGCSLCSLVHRRLQGSAHPSATLVFTHPEVRAWCFSQEGRGVECWALARSKYQVGQLAQQLGQFSTLGSGSNETLTRCSRSSSVIVHISHIIDYLTGQQTVDSVA